MRLANTTSRFMGLHLTLIGSINGKFLWVLATARSAESTWCLMHLEVSRHGNDCLQKGLHTWFRESAGVIGLSGLV